MRDNAKEMDTLYRQRAENSAPCLLCRTCNPMQRSNEQRAQQTQKLVPAFQALYNSMSEQQKADADRVFRLRSARAEAHHHQAATQ